VKKPYADLEDLNNSFNVIEPCLHNSKVLFFDEDAKAQDAVILAYLKETSLKKPSLTRPMVKQVKQNKINRTHIASA
jgi:hypothetical protein